MGHVSEWASDPYVTKSLVIRPQTEHRANREQGTARDAVGVVVSAGGGDAFFFMGSGARGLGRSAFSPAYP